VKLYDGGNNLVATTTTDGSGLYSFTGLTPGTYYVVFTAPGGYVFTSQDVGNDASDSDANTSTGKTGNYTLASGQNNTTVDAGLYRPAALGDFVWHDTNANGIQDGGEAGISGVTVKLYDTGNNLVATTTTDGAGKYLFSGLTPGTYYVQFATPSGYVASPKDQGADDGKDSDADAATGKTGNYTLVSGQTDLSVDAGYYQYASLGDFVWEDLNGNGKQDAGEPGISGVSVELRRTSDDSSVATTTTNGSGYYSFTGLVPDTYYVVFTAPTGYVFTAPNQGGDDTKDSDVFNGSETGDYTLSSGEKNLTVDAGLYRPAKLGDFVWNDLNGDGDQDAGEPGVLGVVVTLTGTDGAGNSVTKTTTTDSNGAYLFTDLAPGTYCVKFSNLPAGFIFTGKDLGGNDAKDSDADTTTGKTGDYTLASGDDNRTVDAGLFDTNAVKGSLAGFVYCDADNDGVKDAGEAGIGGVTIKLTGTDYLGRAVNLTTTTAADGSYKFTDLYKSNAAGYTITETQPGGYADGKDAVGSLGGTLGNDVLSAIVLGAGQNGVHYDFGERCGQVTTGMTATIGFWQNKNGQALIKSVNGGGSSTALGDWLASNFPNLFGTLAGKNNWDVAAYFVTLFKAKGPNAPKTEAQVMAGALAAYVTNSTLAGGNYAAGYGFTVNNSGTGAATWNVGDNGEAFGVADNTTLTVLQGLQLIDAQSTNGKVFPNDTAKRVQVNTFFTEINEAGDII
jgi:protocatechuate 3,4-dioxygenase beta subunit